MLDSEKTFKIKVRSRWAVFKISIKSAVICIRSAVMQSFAWKQDRPISSKLQS